MEETKEIQEAEVKPYYQDEWVTQHHSDALTMLRELESDSVDLLCTDPPYGISFMGKDWDKALPDKTIWAECLRVLEPGAFAFVMSIPRSDCLSRMIVSLEDAGFRTNFTPIYWAYASGFPKAQNIGKAVDKRRWGGKTNEIRHYLKQVIAKSGISHKAIKEHLGYDYKSGVVSNWTVTDSGASVPSSSDWLKLKAMLPIDDRYDDLILEVEREVIGMHYFGASSIYGSETYNKRTNGKEVDITNPATPQAKALDGSYGGFQPKPAVEVIIVCMKPLSEKTFVDQALKNRKGITWLDDCRIPYESDTRKETGRQPLKAGSSNNWGDPRTEYDSNSQGRFPANLLVSDDVLNDGQEHKTGDIFGSYKHGGGKIDYSEYGFSDHAHKGDSGSFSRYFDLDKCQFFIVPKASKSEKNKGLDMKRIVRSGLPMRDGSGDYVKNEYGDGSMSTRNTLTKNTHPTVKPLKLMSYLITLGSRAGDTILDPFGGSGTTALASKLLGRKCITAEIEESYCQIAAKRCSQGVMRLEL